MITMKNIKKILLTSASALLLLSACHNADKEFDNYDYSGVYFAYQYPVRTLVLGEDSVDNTLDNNHCFEVYATMGGVYENKETITIDIEVDNSLCDDLYLDSEMAESIEALPESYYTLSSDKIVLDKDFAGAVTVSLSDEFFEDVNAVKTYYALPIKMTRATNVDKILSGEAEEGVTSPVRTNSADWKELPKDYVLYMVKFVNPYAANYLRRGVDDITFNGTTEQVVRKAEFVEKDEVCTISTLSIERVNFPVAFSYKDGDKTMQLACDLTLTFDDKGECTILTQTPDFTATGTGRYVKDGEANSWGNQTRSALYLEYSIIYKEGTAEEVKCATDDTLVLRDRGISLETLSPNYIK